MYALLASLQLRNLCSDIGNRQRNANVIQRGMLIEERNEYHSSETLQQVSRSCADIFDYYAKSQVNSASAQKGLAHHRIPQNESRTEAHEQSDLVELRSKHI